MKNSSYNPMPFDRERYAAKFATPITPDPSLMKPVDTSEWSPLLTTPVLTPVVRPSLEDISLAASTLSPMLPEVERKKTGMLRPSAKVFIPTNTPVLKNNPQLRRAGVHSIYATPNQNIRDNNDRHSLRRSILSSPAQSATSSPILAPIEVPKALTPLAAPSAKAGLPARPNACAVSPNLPRWATSPSRVIMTSFDKRSGLQMGLQRPSIIRRASPPDMLDVGNEKSRDISGDYDTPFDEDLHSFETGTISAVTRSIKSDSMTPWARHNRAEEREIEDDPLGEKISTLSLQCESTKENIQSGVLSPEKMPSRGVLITAVPDIKPAFSTDNGETWKRKSHNPSLRQPRRPGMTPSIPGGLLGAVPMHTIGAK
ncbi:hypothetical protein NliqN6_0474 [Naganishia liquefaciens]|uniref:Uncharacterized protein n=1 Tax=Naganishia liquefaciens TaxID=104408 RepID=A0A8H3YD90_9TREE|nr:hypothetical protein NliqN6_0474 [Naganishia liquefaciens]